MAHVEQHTDSNNPSSSPQRCCRGILWIIYGYVRCCCCLLGCWCSGFWLLLLWALISLSSIEFDGTVGGVPMDWDNAEDTCYHTLHVTPDATHRDIQKSFRKLALKFHPDKATADDRYEHEQIFKEISHCYDILGDEHSRKRYDAAGFRETNADGIPFDGDVTLQDIWTFFQETWKEAHSEQEQDRNRQRRDGGKHRKRKKKRKRKENQKGSEHRQSRYSTHSEL